MYNDISPVWYSVKSVEKKFHKVQKRVEEKKSIAMKVVETNGDTRMTLLSTIDIQTILTLHRNRGPTETNGRPYKAKVVNVFNVEKVIQPNYVFTIENHQKRNLNLVPEHLQIENGKT